MGVPRPIPAAALVALFLAAIAAPSPATAGFAEGAALSVEAVVPVLGGNVQAAHQEALGAAFRTALVRALQQGGLGGRFSYQSAALEHPARYVVGYRVVKQERRDIFYRLELQVWVDHDLLRREMLGARGG